MCYHTVYALFDSQPSTETLPEQLNGQILTAMYDYRPREDDKQAASTWLSVQHSGIVNLIRLHSPKYPSHVAVFAQSCMDFLQKTTWPQVASLAHQLLADLFTQLTPTSSRSNEAAGNLGDDVPVPASCLLLASAQQGLSGHLGKIDRHLQSGLTYKFNHVWSYVFDLFAAFYQLGGHALTSISAESIASLCSLVMSRDWVPSGGNAAGEKGALLGAIGSAITHLGPEAVLTAYPLNISGKRIDDLDRSWLIPLLKEYVKSTELHYWIQNFFPLADTIKSTVEGLEPDELKSYSQTLTTLEGQIWSLLPSFCRNCQDITKSFTKQFAKTLGSSLSARKDQLGADILAALRNLINSSSHEDGSKHLLASFAKNYLPIMFNLFASEDTKPALANQLSETIRTYFTICPDQLIPLYYEKAWTRFDEATIGVYTVRDKMLDLIKLIIPRLSSELKQAAFSRTCQLFADKSAHLWVKKAYKLLTTLLENTLPGTNPNKIITSGSFDPLHEAQSVLESCRDSQSITPSISTLRLRCYTLIIKALPARRLDYINTILPEVIMSMNMKSGFTKKAAAKCLREISDKYIAHTNKDTGSCVDDMFQTTLAGFAGSHDMVLATIVTIKYLLIIHKDNLSSSIISHLLKGLFFILISSSLEAQTCTLECIKVLVTVTPAVQLSPFLQDMVQQLSDWNYNTKYKYKSRIKIIVLRLSKKFSFEEILSHIKDDGQRKMVLNLKKAIERSRRKRDLLRTSAEEQVEEEEDDEDNLTSIGSDYSHAGNKTIAEIMHDLESSEDDGHTKTSVSTKKEVKRRKGQLKREVWLKEEGESPLDLLEPGLLSKVSTTNPEVVKEAAMSSDSFKLSKDGRLIIEDDTQSSKAAPTLPRGTRDKFGIMEDEGSEDDGEDEERRLMRGAGSKGGGGSSRKRGRVEMELGGRAEKARSVGGMSKKSSKSATSSLGHVYKAKKARGDVTLKGKLDPYAYIPLDRQTLNKRKRAKLQGKFKGLVKASRHGSAKGRSKFVRTSTKTK